MITLEQDWKQWAEALESGEYKQGRNMLGDKKRGFCCLGVRCLIHNIEFNGESELPPQYSFHRNNEYILNHYATEYNDYYKLPFKAIAQKIRKHAEEMGWS